MVVAPDAIQLGAEQEKLFSCGLFVDLKDGLWCDVLARIVFVFFLITLVFNQTRFIFCRTKYKYNSTLRTEMRKK